MSAKKFFMIVDTETCSDYVFDLGFTIVDRKGNIVETGSYLVSEFINNPYLLNMFTDPFTSKKIGEYYYALYSRTLDSAFKVEPFEVIFNIFNQLCEEYKPVICAYNLAFDLSHLDKTAKYFNIDRFIENDSLEKIDLWNSAMSILSTKAYISFCAQHDFYTPKGNIRTDAETMYRFISGNVDFEEKHTAFEDTKIEREILMACLKKHKRFDKDLVGMVLHNKNWRRIQDMR